MPNLTVVLFGEAEKGEYHAPYSFTTLSQMADCLGNPPTHSRGLDCAVQAIYYNYKLIFFRVRDEGFSEQDYHYGIYILKTLKTFPQIGAICIPGVGSTNIIDEMVSLCHYYHSILITTESDFYDYLTSGNYQGGLK